MSDTDDLPEEIRPIYQNLDSDVVWVHAKWKVYRQLFGTSEDRIDILNRSAAFFFGIIQQTLLEDILVSLSRLTDPAASLGNKEEESKPRAVGHATVPLWARRSGCAAKRSTVRVEAAM